MTTTGGEAVELQQVNHNEAPPSYAPQYAASVASAASAPAVAPPSYAPEYAQSASAHGNAYPQLESAPIQQQPQPQPQPQQVYAQAPIQQQIQPQQMYVQQQPQPQPQQVIYVQQQPQQIQYAQQQYLPQPQQQQQPPQSSIGGETMTGSNNNSRQQQQQIGVTARQAAQRQDEAGGGCCTTRNVWLFFVIAILIVRIMNISGNEYYVTWWNILLLIGDIGFTGVAFLAGCRYSMKWAKIYYFWLLAETVASIILFIWVISDSYEDWCEDEFCSNYDSDDEATKLENCIKECHNTKGGNTMYYVFDFILIGMAFIYFRKFKTRLSQTGQ